MKVLMPKYWYAEPHMTPGIQCKYKDANGQVHDGPYSFPESMKRKFKVWTNF